MKTACFGPAILLCLALLCPLVHCAAHEAAVTEEEKLPSSVFVSNLNSESGNEVQVNETTAVKELPVVTTVDKSEPRDFGLSLIAIVTVGAVVLLPILAIIAIIFLIPVPALFFPTGTLPGVNNGVLVTGKTLKSDLSNALTSDTFRGIMDSDNCIQRISCEILRASKGMKMDKWIYRIISEIPVGYDFKQKIVRAAQPTRNCQVFSCRSFTSIFKIFS